MEPCPFHDGYEQFSSQQRLCAYAEMRAERDRYRELFEAKYSTIQAERDRYRQVLETLEGRVHICRDDRGYRAEECPGCDIRAALQEEE